MKDMFKYVFFFFIFVLILAACSGQKNESLSMDQANSDSGESVALTEEPMEKSAEGNNINQNVDRMVIYKADLRMRVKNYEQAQKDLEVKAKNYGGFIIESNVYRDNNGQMNGSITIRIPQEKFQYFLHDAEGTAEEILERNVNGQDVTEEYVDLESRLRSKRIVEERLLEFMKKAQKTEDLLKISSDLAIVQEEIEQILGRMQYLENQTALSTINFFLFEENVIVPSLDKDELNTWEKTKKQFVTSTNFLLNAFSSLVVFFIGNLPVLILLTVFFFLIYFGIKRISSRPAKTNNAKSEDGKDK